MTETNDQVTNQETTDNPEVVDVLGDLNEFNVQGSEESQEEVNEESLQETEQTQEEKVAEARKWLIENKFEDTEEGREKLAKSYRELQSKHDKEKPGEEVEKLKKLDAFLKENPNVVNAMKSEMDKMQSNLSGPPEKPEDYDSYDEDTPGTASYEWRQSYNQYLIDQGRNAAKSEVNTLREEMQIERQQKDRMLKLKSMGMSENEIEEYDNFMTDDKRVTEENLVEVFRFLKAKESGETVNRESTQPAQQKRTSAAEVSGATPPQGKSKEKAKDDFFKGLMKFSR